MCADLHCSPLADLLVCHHCGNQNLTIPIQNLHLSLPVDLKHIPPFHSDDLIILGKHCHEEAVRIQLVGSGLHSPMNGGVLSWSTCGKIILHVSTLYM